MSRSRLLWMLVIAVIGAVPLLAGNGTFTTGNAPIAIADNTGALGTCQTITVPSGGGDVVGDVNVSIAASHSWIGDLTFRVQAPGGSQLTLINRPGRVASGAGEDDNLLVATPITYDDSGAGGSAESMGSGCSNGNIGVTAGCTATSYIPAPNVGDTPVAGVGTNLAQYTGLASNGVWTLCVADSAAGDTGTLSSWSLTFTGSTPVELQDFSIDD